MKARKLLLVLSLLIPGAAFAQADEEGTKDHPDIPRFPGYYILSAADQDFSSFEFPIAEDKYVSKEGRHYHIEYRLKDDEKQPGSLQVLRNYQNAFAKRGGKTLYQYDDGSSGETTLSMPLGKSERWMLLRASPGAYNLDIVELKAMEQKIEVSASEMLDALNRDGFIALHGILFDTAKDSIKPESEPLLAEIVSLLKSNASLRLSVEGHTDNVGQAKANRSLSQRRADRVKKYLVDKGISAKRLATKGWGDTKPIADNRTEDGRAKNRRVELVKK
ncbi:MAG: OmpA family protein [Deltaproteobacteria bacterium]|nr:OmpA family protein [Deltaproteobacteria bacterium]